MLVHILVRHGSTVTHYTRSATNALRAMESALDFATKITNNRDGVVLSITSEPLA